MRKKSSLYIIAIVALLAIAFLLYNYVNGYEDELESLSNRLDIQMNQYDELHSDYIKLKQDNKKLGLELDDVLLSHGLEHDDLLDDIEAYEYLIDVLTGGYDEESYQNRYMSIVSNSKVSLGDLQFDLPKNGLIRTDTSTFEMMIKLELPPEFRDKDINNNINDYPRMLTAIDYPKADEEEVSVEYFRVYYKDLEIGDQLEIKLPYYLTKVLDLDKRTVHVMITDDFDKGSDYVPRNIFKKVFTGGYENGGYTETYEYLDDHTYIMNVEDTAIGMRFEYNFENSVRMTKQSRESSQDLFNTDVLILPEVIKIGESWQHPESNQSIHVITGVGVIRQTLIGPLETIEVSTFYDSDPFGVSKTYYSKELGMVYSSYFGYIDELVDVEFKEQ